MQEIAIKINANPSNNSHWNHQKPFNHEYSNKVNAGNAEDVNDSEEEKKDDPAEVQKATLPSEFLVKDPLKDVYTQVKQANDYKTESKTYK